MKRLYMRHDVIDDRYGRLYEIPHQLAQSGEEVLGVCLSYQKRQKGVFEHNVLNGKLTWVSYNSGPLFIMGLPGYFSATLNTIKAFDPDLIIAGSDALNIIVGWLISRSLRKTFVVDLYDNFDAFGLTQIPGAGSLYRKALKSAAHVSAVSRSLRDMLVHDYGLPSVSVIESTIDPRVFNKRDTQASRRSLGISDRSQIVVSVSGALDQSRDIQTVLRAFSQLEKTFDKVIFLLAGTLGSGVSIPDKPNFLYLGQLRHEEMPSFYCASDVTLLPMADTAFGKYAFPQKLYEILGCRTPIVAADVGSVGTLLSIQPAVLYQAGNASSLAAAITTQINSPTLVSLPIPSWRDQARKLLDNIELEYKL